MEWYEIHAALKYQYYAYKEEWEQSRLIAYVMAQVNSKKRLKLDDIVKFPWDENDKVNTISKEDIERLNKMSQKYTKHG